MLPLPSVSSHLNLLPLQGLPLLLGNMQAMHEDDNGDKILSFIGFSEDSTQGTRSTKIK